MFLVLGNFSTWPSSAFLEKKENSEVNHHHFIIKYHIGALALVFSLWYIFRPKTMTSLSCLSNFQSKYFISFLAMQCHTFITLTQKLSKHYRLKNHSVLNRVNRAMTSQCNKNLCQFYQVVFIIVIYLSTGQYTHYLNITFDIVVVLLWPSEQHLGLCCHIVL